jgi:hypothetical protein
VEVDAPTRDMLVSSDQSVQTLSPICMQDLRFLYTDYNLPILARPARAKSDSFFRVFIF